jgi:hypothetical protein
VADRDLTLDFFGRDVSASATAEKLAAKLRVLEQAQNDNADAADNLGRKLDEAHQSGFKPILDTALLLGPALVPIGAAAVAAGAGLGAMGLTAVAAFKGIQREMQLGTDLGKQYQAAFDPVINEWHQLEHIAAANVFDGLNRGIRDASAVFPEVNRDVSVLSQHLGDIAGNVGASFVHLFETANPLFFSMADSLDKGSAALLRWSESSSGAGKFISFAQQQLPTVEATLKNVATAFGHISEAALPIGTVVLQAISGIAAAISRIPVPVLTGLIIALDAGRIASIAGGIGNLATQFGKLRDVAAGSASLGSTFGIAGIAAGVLTAGLVTLGASLDRDIEAKFHAGENAAGSFAAALQSTNGAVDENVRRTVAAQIQTLGLDKAFAGAGFTLADLTDAVTGSNSAFDNFQIQLVQQNVGLGRNAKALADLHDSFQKQVGVTQALSAASVGAAGGMAGLTEEQKRAKQAADEQKQATDQLIASLNTLQNQSLNAAQIELNYKAALDGAKQQVQQQKTATLDNTAAGRANQSWLLTQIGTLNQHADAVYKSTGSTKAMDAALASDEAQLIAAAGAAGYNTSQVQNLINTYAHVPANVSTYLKTVDGASGVIQSVDGQLRALDGRIVYTTITTQHNDIYTVQDAASGRGAAGVTSRAVGGPLEKGWNLVGEHGPELIQYSGTKAMVYTAQQTVRMLPYNPPATRAAPIIVNVYNSGSVVSERDLVRQITNGIDSARKQRGHGSVLDG